jgi:putative hydrolase of the HAD superfamily
MEHDANETPATYDLPHVVLFDMDGVLAIGEPFAAHLARLGTVTLDQSGVFFGGPFQQCLVGRADLKRELAPYLAAWGWPGSVDEFLAAWFAHEHVINEPLVARIRQLRADGVACYIATNQERYRTDYIREQMGFGKACDGVFSSAELGCAKHDTAFFARLLSRLRVRTVLRDLRQCDALFWDDSAANVAVARAAGLRAEQYTSVADFDKTMRAYGL